jgi:hypothetical protein
VVGRVRGGCFMVSGVGEFVDIELGSEGAFDAAV